ncbi:hypothetical protein D3C73_1549250 [compost metagenome]
MQGQVSLSSIIYGQARGLEIGLGDVSSRIPDYGWFRLGDRSQEQDEIAGKEYSRHGGVPCLKETSNCSSCREKPAR